MSVRPADVSYAELFRRATDAEPFPWQTAFAVGSELPELVRVPTGAGKTEGAVLGWLWRRRYAEHETRAQTPRRLVYCLPLRVLVEQTVSRIEAELEAAGITDVRVHQLMSGAVSRDWTERPEDDAVVVGTLDQLISRALMRGYGVSRFSWPIHYALLHNDSLWVYDEVQLMGEALATSVQLDGFRTTFPSGVGPWASVWMSATVDRAWLETVDRRSLHRALEVSDADRKRGLGVRLSARKTVSRIPALDAPSILGAHRSGTLTLVVVNTVRAARTIFERLVRARGREAEVVLVHSRFRPPDRRARVEAMLAPIDPSGAGRVVVSTQVVEAGVDISAATLITEAAPWASLVQRFGRCNRSGELSEASVLWAPPSKALPYAPDEVAAAADVLDRIDGESVSPDALEELDAPLARPPRRFVLRRRDFLGLFDTAPDVSGLDVDVARYIRDADDLTLDIAWRELPERPASTEPDLAGEELCPAAIGEMRDALRKFARSLRPWRFDTLGREWVHVSPEDLRPGDRLLADVSFGRYTPLGGFDPASTVAVPPLEPTVVPAEAVDSDEASVERGAWLTIAQHTDGVCETLERLLAPFRDELGDQVVTSLRIAARFHDRGKAHAVFQAAMHADAELPETHADELLAKRVGRGPRYDRPGFRHELASLLAYLAGDAVDNLAAYLIASHHGRVRLGARSLPVERWPDDGRGFALGCWHGDGLPETDLGGGVLAQPAVLTLDALELGSVDGPTYTDRALSLLDRLGPYRLAFLELLLRTADRRRSAEEERNA